MKITIRLPLPVLKKFKQICSDADLAAELDVAVGAYFYLDSEGAAKGLTERDLIDLMLATGELEEHKNLDGSNFKDQNGYQVYLCKKDNPAYGIKKNIFYVVVNGEIKDYCSANIQ